MTKHWEHPHFSYAEQIAFLIAKYDEPIICDDDMSAERCRLNCILHGKNPDLGKKNTTTSRIAKINSKAKAGT